MTVPEYNRCVERFSDNVYRFALKSLRNEELAKDIVQESFLKLWENRGAVIGGKEKSYLFTIAYRLIIDSVRHEKRYALEELMPNGVQHGEKAAHDTGEMLLRFLERLPPVQKNVVMLRDYEGYSYREIAEMTSLTEAQVKVYIFRARVTLKKNIGDINRIL